MKKPNLFLIILIAGFIAGTIDILSAIFILAGGNAVGTLKYIASGVFGKSAFEGGNEMAVYGLIFHYIIAACWTGAFILLYPKLPFLHWNKWFNAIAYGLIVQTLMSFIVLPLTHIPPRNFNLWGFTENALILMYAIGLPAVLAADLFYKREEN